MRPSHPFRASDLLSLEDLYESKQGQVIRMVDVFDGITEADYIAVRHDVDDNAGSFDATLQMARWEYERGYRSTYFLLHSASYWQRPDFFGDVQFIASLGHEVGIHANGIATAIRSGGSPDALLGDALASLREIANVEVIGEVAHGDELCRFRNGGIRFVNDEMFTECARPEVGEPDRIIAGTELKLEPKPLAAYGLLYDSNRLPRKYYASDSGGHWSQPWEMTVEQARAGDGQLHLLIHPDWWTEAF